MVPISSVREGHACLFQIYYNINILSRNPASPVMVDGWQQFLGFSAGLLLFLLLLKVSLKLDLGRLQGLLKGLVQIVSIGNGHDDAVGYGGMLRHGPVKIAEFDHNVSGPHINVKYIPVNVLEVRRHMELDARLPVIFLLVLIIFFHFCSLK